MNLNFLTYQKVKVNGKGFTLIELLVVIAIIGLLATMAVVALNSARAKSRDAKRVADIRQITKALEMYQDACGVYPSALATATANGCSSGTSFGTFMSAIPSNPSPGGSTYTFASASPYSTYTLTYTLEGTVSGLGSTIRTATPAGM